MIPLRLLPAFLLLGCAALASVPTASAWCVVNAGPDQGFVCTGPSGPGGQPSTCAYYDNTGFLAPGGNWGCVAAGTLGVNLLCVRGNEISHWFCV